MPQTPIPSAEIWNLYPSLAVIVLVMIVVFAGLVIIWREYKAYAADQDAKRTEERKAQRAWEEQQDAIRDTRWQDFINAMRIASEHEDALQRGQLADMARTINQLSENSRLTADSVGQLSVTVKGLSDTLTGHIAVDDARFDVLLSPNQKAAFVETLEKNANHGRRRNP